MKIVGVLVCVLCFLSSSAQPKKVTVENKGNAWQLLVDGQPYYVKGAGGHVHQKKLVEIGGNTIRTWGLENARAILDEAQNNGLMVMMGLWVQHERHGFDYDDPVKVQSQLDAFRSAVLELKDHPALLLWGVGNEVDLFYKNTNVWYAIEDISKMIHEVDPNHPTCTVTAGFDPLEAALIMERAPSIDIYGINTYGDIGNVANGIRECGWKKPYMITEWGPNGHWEVAKTSWNAPIEQGSFEKAESYEKRYQSHIEADATMCIGSFVFLWGQKQETTSTWYGLFSENGESSEAIDRLHKIWKNEAPANSAPVVRDSKLNGTAKSESVKVEAGNKCFASTDSSDPNGDPLRIRAFVIPESTDIKSGGDAESAPVPLSGLRVKVKEETISFYAPSRPGNYRLFIFAYDKKGTYGYENLPFQVIPASDSSKSKRPVAFKHFEMSTP